MPPEPVLDPAVAAASAALAARLGHDFADPTLFAQALRHRSWCGLTGEPSNERLEYLGDAVVGLAVARLLYAALPDAPEGTLAALRSDLVSTASLAEVGLALGVGEAVRLDRGEEADGGRVKASIVCDATEALVGAVLLDAGLEAAAALVERLLGERVAAAARGGAAGEPKGRLQDLSQRRWGALPEYAFAVEGPDHAPVHTATVAVGGRIVGRGCGGSKKQAGVAAAETALAALESGED